jgi:hypothetical protein
MKKRKQFEEAILIPTVKLNPRLMVSYLYHANRHYSSNQHSISMLNLQDNKPNPELSGKAQKRLKNVLNWLVASNVNYNQNLTAKPKNRQCTLTMITLTLSDTQQLSDQEIKTKLLNTFLTDLRRKFPDLPYVWKAEKQANGNIHFHIISPVRLQYMELRNLWNRIQKNAGVLEKFSEKFNHENPNSTDIKYLAKVKNATAYVAKYMAKSTTCNLVSGRLWGCSYNLSQKLDISEEISGALANEIRGISQNCKKIEVEFAGVDVYIFDWFLMPKEYYPITYNLFQNSFLKIPFCQ